MFTPVFPSGIHEIGQAYLRLLEKWNLIHSLTALAPEGRFEALLLDSAVLLPHLELISAGCLVADFGSGIGIPAVVIAAHRPDLRVIAIERRSKKIAFIRQVALELKLDNLTTICASVESMMPMNAHFGTAKAVGSLDLLLAWWDKHGMIGAPFFALKGPKFNTSEIGKDWNHQLFHYQLPNLGVRTIVKLWKTTGD
jgi:16S rRNA (guanine527-N7)-methyltransferase